MDNREAKFILGAYRPNGQDAGHPRFSEALEQARLLGMPDLHMLLVDHPVQLLEPDALDTLADDVFEQVLHRLQHAVD